MERMTGGRVEHAPIERDPAGHAVIAVELERRPGRQALLRLQRGEAGAVTRHVEGLARQDTRRLVMSMPVARRATEHRHDHVGPKAAHYADHILEQRIMGPEAER